MPRRTFQLALVAIVATAALALFWRRQIEPPADYGKWTPV